LKGQVHHIFIQLVLDPEFNRWVRSKSDERTVFWKNWAKGHAERQMAMNSAIEFLDRLQYRDAVLMDNEQGEMLEMILKDKPKAPPQSTQRKRNWVFNQWIKVAAILLVSLFGGYTLERLLPDTLPVTDNLGEQVFHTLNNPKGRRSEIKLPDGSKVHLSHDSELVFPQKFEGGKREVILKGEAFFDVAQNDTLPFIVKVNGLDINVLGTSFNVKSKTSEFQSVVSLVTGKLRVGINGQGSELELTPGEQVSLDLIKSELNISSFNVEKVTGWKDGIIHFRDAGMDVFIEKMEEWYGVNFQVFGRPSKDWKINAKYQGETLEEILMGLEYVYGITFKINGKKVWIKINEPE
jgi:transmembrane sensor